jgi:hypothetical protein
LERDAALLEEEVTGDRFFNFLVTGHHLSDWIRRDTSVESVAKGRLAQAQSHRLMRVCEDLANASKHFVQRGKDSVRKTESNQGWGFGRFGKGGFDIGEESIEIEVDDGTIIDALALTRSLLAIYAYVFEGTGSLPS